MDPKLLTGAVAVMHAKALMLCLLLAGCDQLANCLPANSNQNCSFMAQIGIPI